MLAAAWAIVWSHLDIQHQRFCFRRHPTRHRVMFIRVRLPFGKSSITAKRYLLKALMERNLFDSWRHKSLTTESFSLTSDCMATRNSEKFWWGEIRFNYVFEMGEMENVLIQLSSSLVLFQFTQMKCCSINPNDRPSPENLVKSLNSIAAAVAGGNRDNWMINWVKQQQAHNELRREST